MRKQNACSSEQSTVGLIEQQKLWSTYYKLKFIQMISKFCCKPTENYIRTHYQKKKKQNKLVNALQENIFLSNTTHKCNLWAKLRGF